MVEEEARKLGLSPDELRLRRSGDPVKAALARRLRRETTMSLKWVAQQLGINSWKYLSKMLSAEPTHNGQLTFADGIESTTSATTL